MSTVLSPRTSADPVESIGAPAKSVSTSFESSFALTFTVNGPFGGYHVRVGVRSRKARTRACMVGFLSRDSKNKFRRCDLKTNPVAATANPLHQCSDSPAGRSFGIVRQFLVDVSDSSDVEMRPGN